MMNLAIEDEESYDILTKILTKPRKPSGEPSLSIPSALQNP